MKKIQERRFNFKLPKVYGYKIGVICSKQYLSMTTFLKNSIDNEFKKIIKETKLEEV